MSDAASTITETGYQDFLVFFFRISKSAGRKELVISPVFKRLVDEAIKRGHLESLTAEEYRFTDNGWGQADALAAQET